MERATSNVQRKTRPVGCGSNPNNAGEIISIGSYNNNRGDVRELVALLGHGASGFGSSNQNGRTLAQANSVAANKNH